MPRTKKKKSKQYFTESTERAIIRYNNSDNEILRNKIYQEHIEYPFQKLAENIIHTFKFYYFDVPSEDVKHEVVSFLVMNMHKFKAGKGKAFSYFSIVAKNYLILHNDFIQVGKPLSRCEEYAVRRTKRARRGTYSSVSVRDSYQSSRPSGQTPNWSRNDRTDSPWIVSG